MIPRPSCLVLLRHDVFRAASRACANTGKRIAARIAIIAITTSSSIRVNADLSDLRDMTFHLSPPTREASPTRAMQGYGMELRPDIRFGKTSCERVSAPIGGEQ